MHVWTLPMSNLGGKLEILREINFGYKYKSFTLCGNFKIFCITQILREINIVDSRSAKTAIFVILEAVNFVHLVNSTLQKVQKVIKNKIQTL